MTPEPSLTAAAIVAWITIFFLGASLGSFLNVCIARWPVEASVVRPQIGRAHV